MPGLMIKPKRPGQGRVVVSGEDWQGAEVAKPGCDAVQWLSQWRRRCPHPMNPSNQPTVDTHALQPWWESRAYGRPPLLGFITAMAPGTS